jgi:HEAT repeat protein
LQSQILSDRTFVETTFMELSEIQTNLQQEDFGLRLKAIAALRTYPIDVAMPLLTTHQKDPEFLVRTFVARELGNFRNDESFALLLEMMRFDNTPNVRAEAANSLSLFGVMTAGHLVAAATMDDHWLVRRSILGALCDMECAVEIWEVCQVAISNLDDRATRDAAILALGKLAGTSREEVAQTQLLAFSESVDWGDRKHAAYALRYFQTAAAAQALTQLRQDSDHRVVGAALEELLP